MPRRPPRTGAPAGGPAPGGPAPGGPESGPFGVRFFNNLVEIFSTAVGKRGANSSRIKRALLWLRDALGEEGLKGLIAFLDVMGPPIIQDPGVWKLLARFMPAELAAEFTNEAVDEFIRGFLSTLLVNMKKPKEELEAAMSAGVTVSGKAETTASATSDVNGLQALSQLSELQQEAFREIMQELMDDDQRKQLIELLATINLNPGTFQGLLDIGDLGIRAHALFQYLAMAKAMADKASVKKEQSLGEFLKHMEKEAEAFAKAFLKEGSAERKDFNAAVQRGTARARVGIHYLSRADGRSPEFQAHLDAARAAGKLPPVKPPSKPGPPKRAWKWFVAWLKRPEWFKKS